MSEAPYSLPQRAPPAPAPRRRPAPAEPADEEALLAAVLADPREEAFPLDPPLADVRIPVKPPHAVATVYSRNALGHRFPRAEVGEDLHILFSEPGKERQSRLSPDVLVALSTPRRVTRGDYDVDRLGPPDFVLEVLSRHTWRHDLGRKLDCYARLGVRECLLFDVSREVPAGRSGGRDLWGLALTPERREPMREGVLPNGERGVYSAVLGLWAYVAERLPPSSPKEIWALTLRWHDPATGADLPDYDQARAQADAAVGRARVERDRVEAAERRIAELEERLRRTSDAP